METRNFRIKLTSEVDEILKIRLSRKRMNIIADIRIFFTHHLINNKANEAKCQKVKNERIKKFYCRYKDSILDQMKQ